MAIMLLFIAFTTLFARVHSQQISTVTAENHPTFGWKTCTSDKQCTAQNGQLTLDSNFRDIFAINSTNYCFNGNVWSSTFCPDNQTGAKNCALDGVDTYSYFGVTTSSGSLRLEYPSPGNPYGGALGGSRLFLLADDTHYQTFNLLNKEIAFDVEDYNVPCGLNGALYFVSMDADGGTSKYPSNLAGAKYGTGYCDASCPKYVRFVNGQANVEGWTPSQVSASGVSSGTGNHGSCCAEVDIWDANSVSTALAVHPCTTSSQTMCSGSTCSNTCDSSGCDFNPYRMGNTTFYGSGDIIDTSKKFTVVTQFLTTDGTSSGALSEIKRFYIQDGVTYQNPQSNIASVPGNSISSAFCSAQKATFITDPSADEFAAQGGISSVSKALAGGMVLTLSFWDNSADDLLWLDGISPAGADPTIPGVSRGTCVKSDAILPYTEGQTHASVTFSNIRFGDIGSTV